MYCVLPDEHDVIISGDNKIIDKNKQNILVIDYNPQKFIIPVINSIITIR